MQWRYSEFLEAVENKKVERVIFNKDGDVLQALSEGRRAIVITPKDPQLLDTLMRNGVDFQGTAAAQPSAITAMHDCCMHLLSYGLSGGHLACFQAGPHTTACLHAS